MSQHSDTEEMIKKRIEVFRHLTQQALDDDEGVINKLCRLNMEVLAQDANNAYRAGTPIMPDWFYDNIVLEALRRQNPDSEFLKKVEPEPEGSFGKTVELPIRMLSTDKAYTVDELKAFVKRCEDAASSVGINEVWFRATAKLDGFAACFTGKQLITRGNGRQGQDISHAIARGLIHSVCVSPLGLPATKGEIVIDKDYFKNNLSEKYENSRNVIAAAIKEGELDDEIADAILSGNLGLRDFESLPSYTLDKNSVARDIEWLWTNLTESCRFDTDGIVIEVTDEKIKEVMGSTNHHHRWQIAFKKNTEFHDIEVIGITPQTSKSGRITPVVELTPTKVSGVTISRATGHHYGNIINKGIDKGAIVKVCRSGLVIPYISDVVKPMSAVDIPKHCPSCGHDTELVGDNLICTNISTCPAQVEGKIEFFFKTLGNCDGFGPKIIEKLVSRGITLISSIFEMGTADFVAHGISPGVASNLCKELEASKKREVEDWRFLAAFGIHMVGKGGCEKILTHYTLPEIFDLSYQEVIEIDGFGDKMTAVFVDTVKEIEEEFNKITALGFNIKQTKRDGKIESPIAGKTVVFTGSMTTGSRSDMEKKAKSLGAKVSGSVSSKTDYLVCGENVGENKTAAAEKNGTKILSEGDYLKMIAGQ